MNGMSGCIISSTYTMEATVLKQVASGTGQIAQSYYEVKQDPFTGEIIRDWKTVDPDAPQATAIVVPCMVESIADGGIRVAGTTERWGEVYENVDYAKMRFPASFKITKRDRITNVKQASTGEILWREEELSSANNNGPATVFEVLGVMPITDPFGRLTEFSALLQRADVSA